ncbi:hypothetical protein AB0284_07145 [Pseudarthrobacter phenanthrenivorans]|uniref:phosphoribosyltransferase-like protein n=1 Tax=Pseudarthrobacter phenanthrenivorans TaxID=361575 RepID=UPI00344F4498
MSYGNQGRIAAPSQTARGKRWLSNFSPLEQPYAEILLDSLKIVSGSEIRGALRAKLDEVEADDQIKFPALLLVPRKMKEYTQISGEPGCEPAAYETFLPGESLPVTPGSEGVLGNLIRDLAGHNPSSDGKWLHPDSDLSLLREARCRSVVLLSDYSGSGTQVVRFAESLLRNPTIRSWHSGGFLNIYAICFAAAPPGVRALQNSKAICESWFVEPAADFSTATWSDGERQQIISLCTSRAQPNADFEPLGYKGSAGLFATEATIPNNLPSILGQYENGWKPFFSGRVMPTDLLGTIVGYEPSIRRDMLLEGLAQERLRTNWESWSQNDITQLIILILARGTRKSAEDWELALDLHAPLQLVTRLTTFLKDGGFIDSRGRTTNLGHSEILAARRRSRRITTELLRPSAVYYPSKLR